MAEITDGHVWRTRSRHRTREGAVSYQSCHCGLWRVLLAAATAMTIVDQVGVRHPGPGAGHRPAARER